MTGHAMAGGIHADTIALSAIGLLVVFFVLFLIATVVGLLRKLDDRWQRTEERNLAEALHKQATIDTTTVVLISAAVATVITGRHRIRKIRRLLSPRVQRTPWSAQGRLILQGSHTIDRKRSG